MVFEAIMRRIFLNSPIRVKIPGELKGLTIFIKLTFRGIMLIPEFFDQNNSSQLCCGVVHFSGL